ncbi:MAG: hypothetical protein H0X02_01915 [Nitrosomonas sp.]|nr:hypothetical protein [Nitrosomonas sp.]
MKDKNLPVVNEAAFTESHRNGVKRGPRKLKDSVREIVEELGGDPVGVLISIVNGDREALATNHDVELPLIAVELRFQAAKVLMEYIFSRKLSIGGDKDAPPVQFTGKMEVDYTKLARLVKDAKGES